MMNGGLEKNTSGSVGTDATYAMPKADIQKEFDIITAEGSNFITEDAEVNPGYKSDKGNPFYNLYVADDTKTATSNSVYYKANIYAVGDPTASTPAVGYYNYNGDTRVGNFYTTVGGKYRGVAYGLPSLTSYAAATLSGIGKGAYRGVDQPQRILTAAESYFLQAECINRGFLIGDAQTTLENGIIASFTSLDPTATATDATDYIALNSGYADVDYTASERPEVAPDGAVGGLYTIISQKWFALNAIAPYEVWSDYRRIDMSATKHHFQYGFSTGFDAGPAISVSPSNTKKEIPCRLLYPQNEYLYNPVNVGAQPSLGSYPFSRVFWDLN